MSDEQGKDALELLDDLQYHVRALMKQYRTECPYPDHEAFVQERCIHDALNAAKVCIEQHYVHDSKVAKVVKDAALAFIDNTNLEADALRYRKIVTNPDLDIEYRVNGRWHDLKNAETDGRSADELHKIMDPIVDSYDDSNS